MSRNSQPVAWGRAGVGWGEGRQCCLFILSKDQCSPLPSATALAALPKHPGHPAVLAGELSHLHLPQDLVVLAAAAPIQEASWSGFEAAYDLREAIRVVLDEGLREAQLST